MRDPEEGTHWVHWTFRRTSLRSHAVEPDLASLASRPEAITRWATDEPNVRGLWIGYFAAATSATVALRAAAVADVAVHAAVSLDGHPDLAADPFGRVTAETLLLVGSRDRDALERSRRAARRLRCAHRVTVADGAGSLFAEPSTLETAARLAADWFTEHMTAAGTVPATTNPTAAVAN